MPHPFHRALTRLVLGSLLTLCLALQGCTDLGRLANLYSKHAPSPALFRFADGGSTIYYSVAVGDADRTDTLVFFYGGTGCTSWKTVLPTYLDGLTLDARVLVLNKRYVDDRSTGLLACGRDFDLWNNPAQWVSDYSEFIRASIAELPTPPKNVVLVGVSEGAVQAVKTAASLPAVTHLAIIGSGAFTLRHSLATLHRRGAIWFDVNEGAKRIDADPQSVDKTWYGNPYRWWSDLLDLDLTPDLLALHIPILVGAGARDASMPVESVLALQSLFDAAGKTNLTVKIYPDANHRLQTDDLDEKPRYFRELSNLVKRGRP